MGIMALSAVAFAGTVFKRNVKLEMTRGQKRFVRFAVICLILANWAYLVAAGI
jgi:hypothetical protein